MSRSEVRKEWFENVSWETLEKCLPKQAYEALLKLPPDSLMQWEDYQDNEPIIQEYMNYTPAEILTHDELEELYEQLGSEIVKGHYSIDQLHALAQKEKSSKKIRKNE